jgi:alpha-beta hydrolase superfamily lysophospholipase
MVTLPETTGSFESKDGTKIFYREYGVETERARLVIAHGLGEHSGRYRNVIEQLVPRGISIWALDHRGHGQSTGKRGHVMDFQHYLSDLRIMVEMAREERPDTTKIFLLGHSMGGLMVLNFALKSPELIHGVIASSPALGITGEVPLIKKIAGKLMSPIWPTLSVGNELDVTKISHDADVVNLYQSDPLVHDRVSFRWFTEFLSVMETTNRMAHKMEVPTLLQVAEDDHLVNAQSSKEFFEKLKLQDKTFHCYDGLYHEIYNELPEKRDAVLADLAEWLEAHIK